MKKHFLRASASDPLLIAMRQAGIVARMMQNRISNEGKDETTDLPNDDDALRTRRAAKTAIDEVVQELLLDTVRTIVNPSETGVDAEEDTPTVSCFRQRSEGLPTVVIDPIDGTYEYLNGKGTYSICIGVCESGKITSCGVYFPAQYVAYLLPENDVPTRYDTKTGAFEIVALPSNSPSKVIYKNGRVSNDVVARMEAAGFTVKDDTDDGIGVWGAILSCLDGTAAGYVCRTRNVRDIFLGPIIAALPTGFALDWQGNELQWPAGGRVDRAVFGAVSDYKDAIVDCLKMDEQ